MHKIKAFGPGKGQKKIDDAIDQFEHLRAMADAAEEDPDDPVGAVATADVAAVLGKKPQSLSPARDALLKKGLIYSGERGRIAFTVPHFGRYLRSQG